SYNQISQINVLNLTELITLDVSANPMTDLDVSNLVHLSLLGPSFPNNLSTLNASGCSSLQTLDLSLRYLTSLNVSGCSSLRTLFAINSTLSILNFSGCTSLESIDIHGSLLTTLDVSGYSLLRSISADYGQLVSLNASGCSSLTNIHASLNQLTTLNISGCSSLMSLDVHSNHLNVLDVSGCTSLTNIDASSNQLTTLDVSECLHLSFLSITSNNFNTLFLKNGANENIFMGINPNLKYVCADENQLAGLQYELESGGNYNCVVNSYCSFNPGGNYYTIQGNNKFDSNNNNDCDVLDIVYPNLKFNITDGTISGSLISNLSGNYSIPVHAGTHTMTPVFENPSYFNVSPSNVVVNFPTQASPFTQNFCISANGNHPDLEIILVPLDAARPGFDATYKLVFKNKGNTTQSGTVNLTFDDAILDLVAANPSVSSQTVNNLTWDFTNLLPFETREITVTLNVNSPTETPAVNNGDVLNYTATIGSASIDELPVDNTFQFHQPVVNSYDPNDKTCLEGNTIAPDKIGEYVHYMIRFENTGTFPAQNIVVKDMIDTAKFDINSIVPMKGSHSFVTNITAGNKVEFIFQNINLPFDDANNDGYVAFKIKTKPSLVNGDTFSNTANIYFDYNFPIVTNTATTTIQALSRQDFEFSSYFNLYPNPVRDVLNISTKEAVEVTSINIYNTLGQLVLVTPNAQKTKTIDVSSLNSGNYFIKITSDKGTSSTKFIKN
ncbi:T9SS type A sorting domain-containing protein, partial [Flavobacterium sp.]|uniref:T9SS type A sorting domain-containing protein n=1 Tax=Flavobacterium sp. TaxID=239 RepID=UPI00260B22B2